MIYLKKFDTHQEYEEARQNLDLPNVSLCEDDRSLHYNPYEEPPFIPSNIITYEASAKLDETTSSKNKGLHTNAFNTTIKSHTFENGVGTIEFNDDVTNIGSYAFFGTGLVKIEIPNSVTNIGSGPFQSCSGLTSIEIPNSVIGIGQFAFQYCSSLTSVTIGSGVTSIGSNAFADCSGLTSIEIPNSVIGIGNSAFYGCRVLTSITIPNSVRSIGSNAFADCSGLISIDIPSGVTNIGNGPFQSCSGLTSITVDNRNTVYDSRGNCNAIIETITNNLLQGCVNTVIPNTVTSIDSCAFDNCCALTSIVIPNSVISIGSSAFSYCSGLTSITIPSGVKSIGAGAFQNCTSLSSATVNRTTPPTLGGGAFTNTNDCPIYVPSSSVDDYQGATNWSTYASRIQAIPIQ